MLHKIIVILGIWRRFWFTYHGVCKSVFRILLHLRRFMRRLLMQFTFHLFFWSTCNNSIEDLYLSLNVSEPAPNDFNTGISLHVRIKTSKILSCIVYFCSMFCWSKVHHGFLTMLTMLRFCAIWSSKMRYFCSKFKHIPSGFYITSCSISCLLQCQPNFSTDHLLDQVTRTLLLMQPWFRLVDDLWLYFLH